MRRLYTFILALALSLATVPALTPAQAPAPQQQTQPREQTVYIKTVYIKTGKKYHRASCRYLSRSKIPIQLKDAKANGYTPCSVCKPAE